VSTRTVLVTGGGGVGKTTLSAALALTAARRGAKALVVTIDPAKRLSTALGLNGLGADPTALPEEPLLSGAMLDAARSWHDIAQHYAPPEVAPRLTSNPFFEAATQHFPASQAFAAAEEMTLQVQSGAWDVIVVDTPPAAGGIEFFTSPARMRSLIGGRLLKWLTGGSLPGRRLFFQFTAKPALRIADSALGSALLEAVADFLLDLRSAYDGIARRSREIERHLKEATTVVVTTADPAPLAEAARFFELETGFPDFLVFNRVLPESWYRAASPAPGPAADNLRRWGTEAHRQADARRAFSARWHIEPATIPWQSKTPTDLDRLATMIDSAHGLDLDRLLGIT
jgi:anion-transporting  ArsA/GET3 family ATPase